MIIQKDDKQYIVKGGVDLHDNCSPLPKTEQLKQFY